MEKKLQIIYSRKEKLKKLIKNLEGIKDKNSVNEERYNFLKKEYDGFLNQSENKIKEIKEDLKRRVDEKKKEMQGLRENLGNLEMRFKVGEIIDNDFQKSKQPITKKIQRLEKEISQFEKLVISESSSDLGGYLDVKIEKGKGLSDIMETAGISPTMLDRVKKFFLKIIASPKKLTICIVIILAIACLTVFPQSNITGKYADVNNENNTIEIRKDKTFTAKEYGVSLSGNYKIEGKKIIFEFDFLGITFPSECALVKNGFDCRDNSLYKKLK